jgi:hypothetical protein
MDTSLTVRYAGPATQTGAKRPAMQPVNTDLATAKAVAATTGAAKLGSDMAHGTLPDPSYTGEIVLDAQSREVVYRSADARTRRVLRQVPEVAARRLKAYTRSSGAGGNATDPHADIEA